MHTRLDRQGLVALATTTLALASLLFARPANAFCGFYVSGAGDELYNNATLVVMMREGTRTVLAMQNNYQGPTKDFAMVVPVPVVLQEENVKTLPRSVFDRLDQLTAPRLVEYWEQDPCSVRARNEQRARGAPTAFASAAAAGDEGGLGVRVEAQFEVGEYQVVILSAQDSTGLDTWLRREKYNIPADAEPVLRPYVQNGMRFFVAKVDASKVKFENGQAMLSPLRFHYDTEKFELPVRLGLLNAKDKQDLIVHILARGKRYQLANFDNVTIPTNIDVDESTRGSFGAFYAALFDATIAKRPGAVVTEYAWDAGSCDPCPTPPLGESDIATLGGDVVPGGSSPYGYVVTRLHARYGKESLGRDLVFEEGAPIAGGREQMGKSGKLEKGAVAASMNNFQARYAIRHPWTGKIECQDPVRGVWGGPTDGRRAGQQAEAATKLAFAPRGGVSLPAMVREPIPELDIEPGMAAAVTPPTASGGSASPPAPGAPKSSSCGCRLPGGNTGESPAGLALAALGCGAWFARRRRTRAA